MKFNVTNKRWEPLPFSQLSNTLTADYKDTFYDEDVTMLRVQTQLLTRALELQAEVKALAIPKKKQPKLRR